MSASSAPGVNASSLKIRLIVLHDESHCVTGAEAKEGFSCWTTTAALVGDSMDCGCEEDVAELIGAAGPTGAAATEGC